MYRWAYFLPFTTFWMVYSGYLRGGYWHFQCLAFVFVFIPLIDKLVGVRIHNQTEETYRKLKEVRFYRYITYLHVPCQWALVIWSMYIIASGQLNTIETIGFLLAVGICTGAMGITIAHELGHRANKLEQFLSKALLLSVSYTHFFIEHNLGHHHRVATPEDPARARFGESLYRFSPEDPASARFGESLYRFYPRTVFGSWFSAWRLENNRLRKKNLPVVSLHNRMIHYTYLPIVIALVGGWVFSSWQASVFFLAQSVVGFSLLEIINYVEHYGLQRKELSPGRYEKVQPKHSWNSSFLVTNLFLFDLQKHSDHHANATRRYQTLRHFDNAPQLPAGYAGMVLLALFPPLFFKVMNPRAKAAALLE